ncbi:hypothetical protein NQ318_017246 [Aromia moschata]|uniref:Uncharacterized protein n=1 Tax=Aromia moschata TaxID=1265417 RepID=A0AAV8YL31_9CUCU|nr:hypothetical protein NQ318_017246 [Aromia moschata]
MDRVHRFAREKLKMQSDKMKQRLDTTSTETAFEPGDAMGSILEQEFCNGWITYLCLIRLTLVDFLAFNYSFDWFTTS